MFWILMVTVNYAATNVKAPVLFDHCGTIVQDSKQSLPALQSVDTIVNLQRSVVQSPFHLWSD